MKELLEKILTDETVREAEDVEAIAAAQNDFGSWDS